jgi:hypothetical protein
MPRLSKIGAAALAAFGWTSGAAAVTASYLQVAGGGGGGGGDFGSVGGAGGGAGGYLTGTTTLNLTLSYTVTVGAGGAGGVFTSVGNNGVQGSNSQFDVLTASVGGGAGAYGTAGVTGGNGGSGGGGAYGNAGGSATSGQGNTGGTGSTALDCRGSGGGGGAGAVGGNGSSTGGGAGGNGTASSITGTSTTYAGGGGGGGLYRGGGFTVPTGGTGGTGGGGSQGTGTGGNGNPGTANLGGGGGGTVSINSGAFTTGGNGGSGVVIISYASPQKFGGGIVTTSGSNTIHTFQTSGTLSPLSTLTANFLVVAGGGGGGRNGGGGGGAGGYRTSAGTSGGGASAESALILDTNSIYTVTVGAGGANSVSGSNSVFNAITSTGGGRGGSNTGAGDANGASGGSGGGGQGVGLTGTGGAGTTGQGFAGGLYAASGSGGGGGASAVGADAVVSTGGNGGAGVSSTITGSSVSRAGGGGGSGVTIGNGGAGGGGNAGPVSASAPTVGANGSDNTGGGGGGGGVLSVPPYTEYNGGAGGSGVVIISYAGSTQLMAGGTVTISGGNVIHTFTSSGYLTPLKLVNNSLRFRSSASAYLNRTPTTASNRKTWTWSGWVKRGTLSGTQVIFAGAFYEFRIISDGGASGTENSLQLSFTSGYGIQTNAVLRDPAAWYHLVLTVDTTQATASNRAKIYINGNQLTSSGATDFTLNLDTDVNNTVVHVMGRRYNNTILYFDGYMTEVNFIDGQALTPNSFGTFNSYGVWQPITYGGSYGTNGFYLPMNPGSSTYYAPFNGTSQMLSAPANAVFNFSSDFTAECWYNTSTVTNASQPILFTIGSDAAGLVCGFFSGNFYCYFVGTGGLFSSVTPPLNQWVHVAWVRRSGTHTLYINGVAQSTSTAAGTISSTGGVTVAKNGTSGSGANYFQGSVSNFRVNNTALYTANFIPPTSALTAVSGTQLLTLQSATIIDNSTNAFTITNTGSVTTAVSTTPVFANTRTLTADQSPQGNNWTPNNISTVSGSTYDSMTDVPTLTSATAANYCVLNPLDKASTVTNGNLTTSSGAAHQSVRASFQAPSTGLYYMEATILSTTGATVLAGLGLATASVALTGSLASAANAWFVYFGDQIYVDRNGTGTLFGGATSAGGVIQLAIDMANSRAWVGLNNTWYDGSNGTTGNPSTGTNPTFTSVASGVFPILETYSNTLNANFGQQPFTYTPPTNFVALNTFNL